jgi:sugar phosphate isomerase/epimerase
MALLSMNEATTFRWSLEEDLAHYAAAGIPALGVWRHKLSDYGLARGIELIASSGLRVSHLFWAGGFTGSDGRSYRASIDDAADALNTAAAIGAGVLLVYSGARAGHTHNHARRLLRDALRELAPLAAEREIVLALEPMHPGCAGDFTFLTTVDQTLDVLEAVGSEQVKMVLDTYHLGQEEGFVEQISRLAPHVALVQLGDARQPPDKEQNRCPLGEGMVPLAHVVGQLRDCGYDGYFDVELLGEEIERFDYPQLLEHAKRAFDQLLGSRV